MGNPSLGAGKLTQSRLMPAHSLADAALPSDMGPVSETEGKSNTLKIEILSRNTQKASSSLPALG